LSDAFIKIKISSDGKVSLPWDWLCETSDEEMIGLDFIEVDDGESVIIRRFNPDDDLG
jgi:hypothetical protein